MQPFWMVWNENSRDTNVRHGSAGEARTEATRLVRINPGTKFYVLMAVGAAHKSDVDWQDADDLPF